MAKKHGRLQTFNWNATDVKGIVDGSLDLERPSLDTTTHDTGDARTSIQGRLAGTVGVNMMFDEADGGQGGMQADFFTGTERAIIFQMDTAGALHKYTGTGQIESWAISGPNDAPGEVTAAVRFSGSIVEATQ